MALFKNKEKDEKEGKPKKHEKTMFLSPEEINISKDTDPLIISNEKKIIIRQRREEPQEAIEDAIESHSNFLLRINENGSEATLMLCKRPEGAYSEKEILDFLASRGIVYGIRNKTVRSLANGELYYEDVLIAKGSSPQDGHDGFFEFHFNPSPPKKPIVLPDGSVDYNVLGKMELCVKDQLLVTYHKATPCNPGKNIFGEEIEAKIGVDLPPLQCKNCELDENQYEYYATKEGNVTFEDHTLCVTPLYVIDGDLDAATGDVDFHGDVLVQGNVFAGVTIKTTGSITINGHVEIANLFAGKDVLLKNGMQGSGIGKISAKGNVLAKFLEQTRVFAGTDITASALLNCDVEAGRAVTITGKRGNIIGGTTSAAEKVTAFSLGNRVGVATRIIIGLEKNFKTMMEEIDEQVELYSNQLADTKRTLDRIAYQMQAQPSSAELLKQRTEQMRSKILFQSKLNELENRRNRLIDVNERSINGCIEIEGPAYAGCQIIINGVSETLHSEYRDVTFSKQKREIRILSNKLK
ncbi:MAG: DUF342 domain-containing protein [Lachnospiraceae bacterium]